MKENQVCYFVKENGNGIQISFGVYDYEKQYGGHIVSNLIAPETRLINSIPFDEFTSETEWKKVPKGWTYNTKMFELTYDEEKRNKIKQATSKVNFNNIKDIQWCFDHGYLVREPEISPIVEAEYDHKMYRIIKRYPHWTAVYGSHRINYPDKVFETYNEALEYKNELEYKKHEQATYYSIIGVYENLEWALDKYADDYGIKDVDNLRQKFLSMPRFWTKIIRYYNGEILYANRNDRKYSWSKL